MTVEVLNGTSTPVPGVAVDFAVNGAPGTVTPVSNPTNSSGMTTAVFRHGTRSGTATITVKVARDGMDGFLTGSVDLQIDHAAPYKIANLWYEPEVTAGGTTEITVRMMDRYDNVVDDRRVAENVTFTVGSPNGTAVFNNTADRLSMSVDDAGNATATLQVDTMAGENLVFIQPPAPVRGEYITILGVADGEPCTLKVDVQPDEGNPPYVYAGSNSKFLLTYTLRDKFGNPSSGKELVITTNVSNEKTSVITNAYGQARVSYGPWVKPGGVTVTAIVNNTSVACSQDLAFVIGIPTNLFLSANPGTMPSGDVPGCEPAEIRAKLVDQFGNPVPGKEVSFSIEDTAVGENFNQTAEPEFTAAGNKSMTDANGIATIGFWPGAFTTDWRAPGYSPAATGTCKVVAKYGEGVFDDVSLTWKNYPYITVETDVTPDVVMVNETVDVTIRLKGDGWALKPDPIDVILCVDRGARMVDEFPDHMVTVMEAAPVFVDEMIPGWDRIGLVSFGANGTVRISAGDNCTLEEKDNKEYFSGGIGIDDNSGDWGDTVYNNRSDYITKHYPGPDNSSTCNYADHATVDVPLTSIEFANVKNGITALLPGGGNPIRKGLYESIKVLRDDGRKNAVKAVVILGDPEYNWYGDPLAKQKTSKEWEPEKMGPTKGWYNFTDLNSTQQNMSIFAEKCGVRIYAITYSPNPSASANKTMETLAEVSGGKSYNASTKNALIEVYKQIADDLKTEAGVNTTMDIAFENVEVDSVPISGDQVFDYVYASPNSTRIYSYFNNGTVVTGPYARDDTKNWTASIPHIPFLDIGTIHLNQTWEATFRLKVLTDGNINIFGNGSTITFNNDEDTLTLPDTFITAYPRNDTGMDFQGLNISNLHVTGGVTDFLPVAWDLNYTGLETATEDV
ncbi:MAG: hypothetical protein PHP55_11685, partial [Methanoculleus sp.]|nr:hypothetical protein [Methanoculleus sp.]